MFCPKCGTENPESGRFCRSCGVDLGNVTKALSGKLKKIETLTDSKGKDVSWESSITSIFTSIAFFIIAFVLGTTGIIGGRAWWFWMLIPAFTMLGKGISQIYQLKKVEKNNFSMMSEEKINLNLPKVENASLPPVQTEYIKPQNSIYDTGDLVVTPSVTENTTRQLQMNSEGETMTLPKTNKNYE